MSNQADKRRFNAAQEKQLEAALIRQLGSIARDCCHLLDRANATLELALAPRLNRDEEVRQQTLRELRAKHPHFH